VARVADADRSTAGRAYGPIANARGEPRAIAADTSIFGEIPLLDQIETGTIERMSSRVIAF
jgi:hypothetical protein